MYKLLNNYITRMASGRLTSSEIDLILYISQFQDDGGTVHSVYYRDVCDALGFSIQTFYDIIRSLAKKGLISSRKRTIGNHVARDIEVTLIGNDLSDKQFSKGYLKVCELRTEDSRFRTLRAGSKLLFLYSQRFTHGKHMLVPRFYEDFCKMLGVTRKTVQSYVHELKERCLFFTSMKKNICGHYEMMMRSSAVLKRKAPEIPYENDKFIDNVSRLVEVNFGRWCNIGKSALRDVGKLLFQRRSLEDPKGAMRKLLDAVGQSIGIQKREGQEPSLNAALVNQCFSSLMLESP